MKENMLDKNGRPLKGSARWLRRISLDGSMEEHDKKIAMKSFEAFLDQNPNFASYISDSEAKKRRKKLRLLKD